MKAVRKYKKVSDLPLLQKSQEESASRQTRDHLGNCVPLTCKECAHSQLIEDVEAAIVISRHSVQENGEKLRLQVQISTHLLLE